MFKKVVIFMEVSFCDFLKSIFNVDVIEKGVISTVMVNYIGNDLMGRTHQCMNRHGGFFLKPKFNCCIKLLACNFNLGKCFFYHILFSHNEKLSRSSPAGCDRLERRVGLHLRSIGFQYFKSTPLACIQSDMGIPSFSNRFSIS